MFRQFHSENRFSIGHAIWMLAAEIPTRVVIDDDFIVPNAIRGMHAFVLARYFLSLFPISNIVKWC